MPFTYAPLDETVGTLNSIGTAPSAAELTNNGRLLASTASNNSLFICGDTTNPFVIPPWLAISASAATKPLYTSVFKSCAVAVANVSKFSPGAATPPKTVLSNFCANAKGKRSTNAS